MADPEIRLERMSVSRLGTHYHLGRREEPIARVVFIRNDPGIDIEVIVTIEGFTGSTEDLRDFYGRGATWTLVSREDGGVRAYRDDGAYSLVACLERKEEESADGDHERTEGQPDH